MKCQWHDFSRAEKAHKVDKASAPEGMYFASHLENTDLFRSQLDSRGTFFLLSLAATLPNPKWKESLETPHPPAMHPHQALLHGDCFTLRNLARAAGVHRGEFVSPAFHRLLRNCHRGLELAGHRNRFQARVSGRHRFSSQSRDWGCQSAKTSQPASVGRKKRLQPQHAVL